MKSELWDIISWPSFGFEDDIEEEDEWMEEEKSVYIEPLPGSLWDISDW